MVPGFHIIGRIASCHETVQGYPGDFMETIEGFSGRSRKPWRSWSPTSSCIEHSSYEHSFVRSGDQGDYMETRLKRWWTIHSSVVITDKESGDHLGRNVMSLLSGLTYEIIIENINFYFWIRYKDIPFKDRRNSWVALVITVQRSYNAAPLFGRYCGIDKSLVSFYFTRYSSRKTPLAIFTRASLLQMCRIVLSVRWRELYWESLLLKARLPYHLSSPQ